MSPPTQAFFLPSSFLKIHLVPFLFLPFFYLFSFFFHFSFLSLLLILNPRPVLCLRYLRFIPRPPIAYLSNLSLFPSPLPSGPVPLSADVSPSRPQSVCLFPRVCECNEAAAEAPLHTAEPRGSQPVSQVVRALVSYSQ